MRHQDEPAPKVDVAHIAGRAFDPLRIGRHRSGIGAGLLSLLLGTLACLALGAAVALGPIEAAWHEAAGRAHVLLPDGIEPTDAARLLGHGATADAEPQGTALLRLPAGRLDAPALERVLPGAVLVEPPPHLREAARLAARLQHVAFGLGAAILLGLALLGRLAARALASAASVELALALDFGTSPGRLARMVATRALLPVGAGLVVAGVGCGFVLAGIAGADTIFLPLLGLVLGLLVAWVSAFEDLRGRLGRGAG